MSIPFNFKSLSLGCAIGAAGVIGGTHARQAVVHINSISEPSASAERHPMNPLKVDPSWIKSGTPKFHLAWHTRTNSTAAGIWSVEGPTTFEWTFQQDEEVYILDGEVHVDYLDRQFTLKPGDKAQFLADTKATWNVPRYLIKSFVIHDPNLAVRWYRMVSDDEE